MARYRILLCFALIFAANICLAKGGGSGGGHGGGGHSGGGHSSGHGISGHASFGARSASIGHASHISSFGTHTYGPRGSAHKLAVAHNQKRESDYYYHYPYNNYRSDTGRRGRAHLYTGGFIPFYDPYSYQPYAGVTYSFPYSWDYANDPASFNNANKLPEGYVVYNNDTIEGSIFIDDNIVYVKRPADVDAKHIFHSKLSSKKLKCLVAYNDDRELLMVRTDTSYNKLWRVVHQGKITIYDDQYDFIYGPEDVSRYGIVIYYEGKRVPAGPFNNREKLMELVNKAYGVQLIKKEYSWDKLLTYIDGLD